MRYYTYSYETSQKVKVFISFDYDHNIDLKNLPTGRAKNEDNPFEITDMSVKEELVGDWKEKVQQRIRKVDQVSSIQ
jgi:hypothetical protein